MTMHLEDVAKELDRILYGTPEKDWHTWTVEQLLALRQRVRDTLMSDHQEQGFRDTRS